MNEIIIVFASATTASRVKRHLGSLGYYAKVNQTPKSLSTGGCSYCVHTTDEALDAAKAYAKDLDVKIKNIFKITKDGFTKISERKR